MLQLYDDDGILIPLLILLFFIKNNSIAINFVITIDVEESKTTRRDIQ